MLGKILVFLDEIGLRTRLVELPNPTFLPGIDVLDGVLLIDESKLTYPGDVLHEAGHLAILSAEQRRKMNHDAGADPGYEMAAIAWSYAAAIHVNIEPSVIFHPAGYRGGAQAIIDNFAEGRYIGVPILQWLGMSLDTKTAREQQNVHPFPHMLKWVVD